MADTLVLFGYWRSQATYRVRVALNLKGIAYREQPINLDVGEQFDEEFRKVNPAGAVPALVVESDAGTQTLTQSLAILEYLEEVRPSPSLLPSDPVARARVRALASIAASDMHPLITHRVGTYLSEHAQFDAAQWAAWRVHWFTTALQAFEARLAGDKNTGVYCQGNTPTIADICLVALILTSRLFDIKVPGIPTVDRIVDQCETLDAFERAKAIYQSDYPGEK